MNRLSFNRGLIMPKTKKAKKEGLERHRQLQREKKMKVKERKRTTLPKKHNKGRK